VVLFTLDVIKTFVKGKLFFIIPAAAGIFIVLFATSEYGPNITHDSVAYLYAANSLLAGKGLVYFGYGTPIIQWPPLYPVLLSAGGALGVNILDFARYLNAIIFGLIVFFLGLMLLRHVKRPVFAVLGSIAVLLSAPLLNVSTSVWSEPLFILFVILFLMQLESCVQDDSLKKLAAAAVFAAAACMTRYIGITAIAAGVLVLLFKRGSLWRRLGHICFFGFIAAFPTVLWLIRNYALSHTFTGGRTPSSLTLAQNLGYTLNTVASWFIPSQLLKVVAGSSGTDSGRLFIIVCGILVVFSPILAIIYDSIKRKGVRGGVAVLPKGRMLELSPAVMFTAIYMVYLIVTASSVAFDTINNRLLSPVSIPLIFLVFVAIDYIAALSYNFLDKVVFTYLLAVVLTLCIVYPFTKAAASVAGMHSDGAGLLASQKWTDSPVIAYLRKEAGNCTVYSDHPDAIYVHTGINARYTPKKSGIELYGLKRMKEAVESQGSSYIAWFSPEVSGSQLYNAEELKEFFDIETAARLPDGVVYRIGKR
jgi:hypothetical protein